MKTVYVLPEKESTEYGNKLALLTWYVNNYLPQAAGHDHFGPSIRAHQCMHSGRAFPGSNKKVESVLTQESEAHGLFILSLIHI